MKNTKKVYLLIDERSEPCNDDTKTFVFGTKEKAIEKMEENWKNFIESNGKDCIEYDEKESKRRQNDELVLDMRIEEKEVF